MSFLGVLRLEVDELGNDEVGDVLADLGAEEDDPLVKQPRVDVEGALAARALLDHHRNQGAHGGAVYKRPSADTAGGTRGRGRQASTASLASVAAQRATRVVVSRPSSPRPANAVGTAMPGLAPGRVIPCRRC